jgi:hypothetical protein
MRDKSRTEECIWRGEGIHSTRVWNEMENMRAELENMFQLASSGGRLFPPV